MEEGEIIVLVIDLNENVMDSKFTSKLESIGLVEAITTKHFSCCRSVRTHQQGKIPIDGIFIPSSLVITLAGYYSIGQAPSNHCTIWIKIKISEMFGYNLSNNMLLVARRL